MLKTICIAAKFDDEIKYWYVKKLLHYNLTKQQK